MQYKTITRLPSYSIIGFTPAGLEELLTDFREKNPDLYGIRNGRRPKLGPDDGVVITIISYRRNYTEQELADMYGVSQPIINRIIRCYSTRISTSFSDSILVFDQIKDQVKDQVKDTKILLDGTHITTSRYAYDPLLYSGKHKTNGFNLQILASVTGDLLYISQPFPGSIHDSKALAYSTITDSIPPSQIIADKGYIGTGVITPTRKNSTLMKNHEHQTRENNRKITLLRYPVERAIAHLKNWKILSTRYRKKLNHFPHHLTTITTLHHLKNTYE